MSNEKSEGMAQPHFSLDVTATGWLCRTVTVKVTAGPWPSVASPASELNTRFDEKAVSDLSKEVLKLLQLRQEEIWRTARYVAVALVALVALVIAWAKGWMPEPRVGATISAAASAASAASAAALAVSAASASARSASATLGALTCAASPECRPVHWCACDAPTVQCCRQSVPSRSGRCLLNCGQ